MQHDARPPASCSRGAEPGTGKALLNAKCGGRLTSGEGDGDSSGLGEGLGSSTLGEGLGCSGLGKGLNSTGLGEGLSCSACARRCALMLNQARALMLRTICGSWMRPHL